MGMQPEPGEARRLPGGDDDDRPATPAESGAFARDMLAFFGDIGRDARPGWVWDMVRALPSVTGGDDKVCALLLSALVIMNADAIERHMAVPSVTQAAATEGGTTPDGGA